MNDFENMCTCKSFISVLLTRREVLTSVACFSFFLQKSFNEDNCREKV